MIISVCMEKNISTKGPRNCRSLGSPGFPVESGGSGQLHVVLFRENHIGGAGESREVGNPGTLGMTEERVVPWTKAFFITSSGLPKDAFLQQPLSPLSSRAKPRDLQFHGPFLEMFFDRPERMSG
jgi:hypothetical protein